MILPRWFADWPLDSGSLEWLNQAHFPTQLEAARQNIINAGLPDPLHLTDIGIWELSIYLLAQPVNDGSKGRFSPLGLIVEIWWDWELQTHRILRHELQHFLLMASGQEWEYFGHGTTAWDKDRYLAMLYTLGREVYFEGSAYDPFVNWRTR